MNNGTTYIARRGKDCSQRRQRCVDDFSLPEFAGQRLLTIRTTLDPANWIGRNQPRHQNVLSSFQHRLGAMHVGGGKDDGLSNLRSKRETEGRETRLSTAETVVDRKSVV